MSAEPHPHHVTHLLQALVGAAAGAAMGALTGPFGLAIGAALGGVAAFVVGCEMEVGPQFDGVDREARDAPEAARADDRPRTAFRIGTERDGGGPERSAPATWSIPTPRRVRPSSRGDVATFALAPFAERRIETLGDMQSFLHALLDSRRRLIDAEIATLGASRDPAALERSRASLAAAKASEARLLERLDAVERKMALPSARPRAMP